MSNRYQFDAIFNSMINGQRKQAISQAEEMGLDDVPELLDYFADELYRPELALDFCKAYFRITTR